MGSGEQQQRRDGGPDVTQGDSPASDGNPQNEAGNDSGSCPSYTGSTVLCQAGITHCGACGSNPHRVLDCALRDVVRKACHRLSSTQLAAASVACASTCDQDAMIARENASPRRRAALHRARKRRWRRTTAASAEAKTQAAAPGRRPRRDLKLARAELVASRRRSTWCAHPTHRPWQHARSRSTRRASAASMVPRSPRIRARTPARTSRLLALKLEVLVSRGVEEADGLARRCRGARRHRGRRCSRHGRRR